MSATDVWKTAVKLVPEGYVEMTYETDVERNAAKGWWPVTNDVRVNNIIAWLTVGSFSVFCAFVFGFYIIICHLAIACDW